MKTLVIIDSNAIVHRAYHALPKNLANKRGEMTNVTYGFALALIKILEDVRPDYIAAAFDLAAPTFRHTEYVEYKAKRVKADQELYDQIPRVREMLDAFGVPIYAVEGYEADDVIGTVVEQMNKHDVMVYIASGDRDVYQLLNGRVRVLMLKHGFKETEIFDHDHLKEIYNLEPEDFIDLKALAGDQSDNIPGVPGIGPKTATDLILKFDTLENLYFSIEREIESGAGVDQQLSQVSKKLEIRERILKLLVDNKTQAFQSKRLATIRRDVPFTFDLEGAKWGQYDRVKLKTLFEELEFKSLLRRFGKDIEGESKGTTAAQKEKDEQLKLEL
ncbi:MAG: DNA polymerase I [bacterium ADurb.Bin400]|nr:MAG: DNA polymerase I [bacterium ADurb.Bin400]